MNVLRAMLLSRRGMILLALLAAWLGWRGYLVAVAPGKIGTGFPDRPRVHALITLPFPPERFHVLVFQRYGRVSGTDGNTVELRNINRQELVSIARYYWVRTIEPLNPGG
jgi:hypothetical protein